MAKKSSTSAKKSKKAKKPAKKKAAKKNANKSAKKNAKPPATPTIPVDSMSHEAAQIFAETAFATAQGMDREMAKDAMRRAYALTPEARDFWLIKHTKTIPKALENPKNKWTVDRPFVLAQAQQLGTEAAILAMKDALNSNTAGISVTKDHVKEASLTIARGKVCVAANEGKLGSGPYCPE